MPGDDSAEIPSRGNSSEEPGSASASVSRTSKEEDVKIPARPSLLVDQNDTSKVEGYVFSSDDNGDNDDEDDGDDDYLDDIIDLVTGATSTLSGLRDAGSVEEGRDVGRVDDSERIKSPTHEEDAAVGDMSDNKRADGDGCDIAGLASAEAGHPAGDNHLPDFDFSSDDEEGASSDHPIGIPLPSCTSMRVANQQDEDSEPPLRLP